VDAADGDRRSVGRRARARETGLTGLAARALLHELDHLAGRLYVDLVQAEEIVLVVADGPWS
jgi:peptide deformylase